MLMDNDQMRKEMSDAGQERMRNDFSIAAMADKHVALYESL
jgi:hypothetical protein